MTPQEIEEFKREVEILRERATVSYENHKRFLDALGEIQKLAKQAIANIKPLPSGH